MKKRIICVMLSLFMVLSLTACGGEGTVALNVNDAAANPAEEVRFAAMASADGYSVAQTLNINVEQRFYKGVERATRSQCWIQPISQTLKAPATIELNVSGITSSDVAVLHHHGDSYEVIPATYSDGKIRFETGSFSDFAIISKGGSTEPKKEESSSSSSEETKANEPEEEVLGNVVGGVAVKSWTELNKVLATESVANAGTNKNKKDAPLVQLVLKNNKSTVPASTFALLANTDSKGLHLFTGNGTAVTFLNDSKLNGQTAVNLACNTVSIVGKKTVTFRSFAKLKASTILHSVVPAGTKKVTIYYTGKDGVRRLLGAFVPNNNGLFCFAITELGKYEFVY